MASSKAAFSNGNGYPAKPQATEATPLVFLSSRSLTEEDVPLGGLGLAIRYALLENGGHWFGVKADSKTDRIYTESTKWQDADITSHTIHIPKELYDNYYAYVNKTRWTVNHDRPDLARISETERKAHDIVVPAVADEVAKIINAPGNEALSEARFSVEDYHFTSIGGHLRERLPEGMMLNFFLHTPIPGRTVRPGTPMSTFEATGQVFRTLASDFRDAAHNTPGRFGNPLPVASALTLDWLEVEKPHAYQAYMTEFIEGMSEFDSIGFQTAQDCRRFLSYLGIDTNNRFTPYQPATFSFEGRSFKVMHAPISIPTERVLEKVDGLLGEDYSKLDRSGKWERLYSALGDGGREMVDQLSPDVETIIYSGAERGDFSKGGPERLRQFYKFLKDNPGEAGKVQFLQVAIPTRGFEEYNDVQNDIEYLAEKINLEFGKDGVNPVILHTDPIANDDAVLLARATRIFGGKEREGICWIGAIRDGKNLTVHECVAAQDPASPGIVVVPSKIGASPDFVGKAEIYDPEDEGAFGKVLARCRDLYRNTPEKIAAQHARALAFIEKNDIRAWISGRLAAHEQEVATPAFKSKRVDYTDFRHS